MSRELYAVAAFYPLVAADLLWPAPALHALAALAAAAFLVCQARILYACKGIPAWRAPLIPWMLVLTGLYEGAGMLAIIFAMAHLQAPAQTPIAGLGLVLALVNAALWRRYRGTAAAHGVGFSTRRELARITPWLHGFGHAVPAVLFLAALAVPSPTVPLALAGFAVLFGGALWKFTLVIQACHFQGFAVPKMPRRGSGARAAPPRLETAAAP